MTARAETVNWSEALAIVRRRWATLLLAVVVGGGGLFIWSELNEPTPMYQASATVLLELRATNSPFKSSGGVEDPRRAMPTEFARLTTPEVQAAVRERVPAPAPVSAAAVGETDMFSIVARSEDPQLAADTANAYADAYVAYRRQRALDAYQIASDALRQRLDGFDDRITQLREQIDGDDLTETELAELDDELAAQQRQRSLLEQRLVEYEVDAVAETGGARVVGLAGTPSLPFNSSRPLRSGLLGASAGAVLGLAALVVIEFLDDRLRHPRQVAALGGLPVLGVVPSPDGSRATLGTDTGRSADPYRNVRSTLLAGAADQPLGMLLVTSAADGDDTAATALHLSLAFARAGRNVLLVSTDFEDGPLHDLIRLPEDAGLSTVISERAPVTSVVLSPPETPNLMVLPAGPLPLGIDAADLLATRQADAMFNRVSKQADLLVVECPPVLESAVASTLARRADAVVVVARLGRTTRGQLREALAALALVNAPTVGFVVHEPHRHHPRRGGPVAPEEWLPVARPGPDRLEREEQEQVAVQ